jgi:acyl-CoA thioesterase I
MKRSLTWVTAFAISALLAGCTTQRQLGESVVMSGQQPARLAHQPKSRGAIEVRSTYLDGQTNTVHYTEGIDYEINRSARTISRTANSRIPDFQTNVLYGKDPFDHSQFPGYGNNGYFAFIDYAYHSTESWPKQPSQTQFLPQTRAKLHDGKDLKIVAFGDSITAGGEATRPALIYWQRWADDLQHRYKHAHVRAINGATGGDTTVQGLQRLQAKVLDQKPDLVLIAFGMNDHNIGSVPIPQFEKNLKELIGRIRKETGAEIILLSTFPPNPKWKYGSHHMQDYAAATEKVASEEHCAFADVFNNWQAVAEKKKPEDLLGNNINHPNDFGHWIYFRVLQDLGL